MNDIATYIPDIPGKWVKRIAQVGLTAKAILYCLLGILALLASFELGKPGEEVDRKSVFLFIENLFLGRVLLGLLAVGLACYCLWRLLQAVKDTEAKGSGLKGIIYRMRYAASGMFYSLLALLAAKLAIGDIEDDDSLRETFTQLVLHKPLGQWVLAAVAAVIALAGAYQVYQGFSGRYRKKIIAAGWKDDAEATLINAGMIGYIARGIVWIILGYLLLQTALFAQSGKAEKVTNVFRFLGSFSYGSYLLGSIALGLLCYGLFLLMEAKFRRSRS